MFSQMQFDWSALLETGFESEALAWIAAQTRESLAPLRTGGLLPSRTPLMVAAAVNANLVAALLPISDASETSYPDKKTALMIAAAAGRADCVELLLPHSDANAIEHWGDRTALHLAAVEGHSDCVRLLAPKSNLSHADSHGTTALMAACVVARWECVRWIANEEAANDRGADTHARAKTTPLFVLAASRNRTDAVIKCLNYVLPHSDVNFLDADGQTAFERAFCERHWAVALAIGKKMDIAREDARQSFFDVMIRISDSGAAQGSKDFVELIAYSATRLAAAGQAQRLAASFKETFRSRAWRTADVLSAWASAKDLIAARDLAVAFHAEEQISQIKSRAEAIDLREAADDAARASAKELESNGNASPNSSQSCQRAASRASRI